MKECAERVMLEIGSKVPGFWGCGLVNVFLCSHASLLPVYRYIDRIKVAGDTRLKVTRQIKG